MSCGRCDDRGYFGVVRYVGHRLVPQRIPCPSCQRSEADELLIAVLRSRIVALERTIVIDIPKRAAAWAAKWMEDHLSGIGSPNAEDLEDFKAALIEHLDASDGKSETSGDDQPDALPVVPAQPPPEEG